MRLTGLDAGEVGALLAANGEQPAPPLVDRVRTLTDGNPFLVQQVLEAGLHHHDRLPPDGALRLLDTQLDALDQPTREVLEAAAVLGRAGMLSELAPVAAVDRETIERAREAAAAAGLVRPERGTALTCSHDLAREAVLARLTPARLGELHRRCVTLFAADTASPERAARRARHSLALAHSSTDEVEEAVRVARASAQMLLDGGAPEVAVELLQNALAVEQAGGSPGPASLITQLGSALLATGRLADARETFKRAIAAADASCDAVTYAQAALGLGGVWVHDHRATQENRAYRDVLDRAITGIADDPSPHARRLESALRLRRAAEADALSGGHRDEVRAALEHVRAVGTPSDFALGLSLLHHLMLGPECAHARVPIAGELVEVAREQGDELHLLVVLMWSAVDGLLLGEDADRALRELRERAEALGMRAIVFISDAIDVMRLMRAGELVAAEEAANRCLERGLEVGDADAVNYYGAHLLALRWYAGASG